MEEILMINNGLLDLKTYSVNESNTSESKITTQRTKKLMSK